MTKFEFPIWRDRHTWRADKVNDLHACVSSFNGYFAIPKEVTEAYVVISSRPNEYAYEIKVEERAKWWGPSYCVYRRCKNNRWRETVLSSFSCEALFRVLKVKGYELGESVYVSVEYNA